MKRITTFFLVILIAGCREKFIEIPFTGINSTNFIEQFFLAEAGIFEVDLDKETGFEHYSMRIDSTLNGEYYSFINGSINVIYIYEYETSQLVYEVGLDYEGPNGVGYLQMASHMIIGLDSILVYNVQTGILHLANTRGEVYWKENLMNYFMNSEEIPEVFPEPSIYSPLVKVNNDIYFVCSISRYSTDYSKTYSIFKINLKTRNKDHLYALPKVYNSGYWGAVFKYIPSFDFNQKTGHMILSFPIDPRLHVMSLDGREVNSHYESSKYIESMTPLRTDIGYGLKKDHNVADTEQREYSLSTSGFGRIIYDLYRNVYYRIAFIRPSIESLRSGRRILDFSISVLDEKFIKVGERKFDGEIYSVSIILLSNEGLAIARKDLYNSNEDLISYTIFKLEETKPNTD